MSLYKQNNKIVRSGSGEVLTRPPLVYFNDSYKIIKTGSLVNSFGDLAKSILYRSPLGNEPSESGDGIDYTSGKFSVSSPIDLPDEFTMFIKSKPNVSHNGTAFGCDDFGSNRNWTVFWAGLTMMLYDGSTIGFIDSVNFSTTDPNYTVISKRSDGVVRSHNWNEDGTIANRGYIRAAGTYSNGFSGGLANFQINRIGSSYYGNWKMYEVLIVRGIHQLLFSGTPGVTRHEKNLTPLL